MIIIIVIAVIFWGVFFFGFIGALIVQSIEHNNIKEVESGILDNSSEKDNQKK